MGITGSRAISIAINTCKRYTPEHYNACLLNNQASLRKLRHRANRIITVLNKISI